MASAPDAATERIVRFLAQTYGVAIAIAFAAGIPVFTGRMDELEAVDAHVAFTRFILSIVDGSRTDSCQDGLRGWSDAAVGQPVVLRDAKGAVVATAALAGGRLDAAGCHLSWTATVPRTPFIIVSLGTRAGVTFSEEDLAAAKWRADIVLK